MFIVTVPSSSNPSKVYTVRKVGTQLICDCKDHVFRSHDAPYVCKHIATVVAAVSSFAAEGKQSASAAKILAA